MFDFSLIVVVGQPQGQAIEAGLGALARNVQRLAGVEMLWVMQDALPPTQQSVGAWQQKHGARAGHRQFGSLAEAIDSARAPWIVLCDAASPPPVGWLDALCEAPCAPPGPPPAVLSYCSGPGAVTPAAGLGDAPPPWHACALNGAALRAAALHADDRLPAPLAAEALVWRLLAAPGQSIGFVALDVDPPQRTEPAYAFWRDRASYAAHLQHTLVEPLEDAAREGRAPAWLQRAVLQQLCWYFTVDARERAPTVIVDAELAVPFHDLVRRAMRLIAPEALEALHEAKAEVRHALLSYRDPTFACGFAIDAYDHALGLARLTYWVHGDPPAERIFIDGHEAAPAYAKLRACNYFGRRLLRERIAWLPVSGKRELRLILAGEEVPVALGPKPFCSSAQAGPTHSQELLLDQVPARFGPGKADLQQPLPRGWAGWKVRLVKALARLPPVQRFYRDAWVFVDRDDDADDSAEHLYRWVRQHHPELNAWYLLKPESADWPRLRAEGFRLLAPGLRRRLLALNCRHIVSSHTGQEFGLDPARYGDSMRWRYIFLQHGVIKDDISHWLNPCAFDTFITSSPAEHASVVGDDTPYIYTEREVRCTGLPRHDRLLRIARETPREEVKLLLVMPTWRGSLVDERMAARSPAERLAAFAESDYARHWRALLNSTKLRQCAREAGLQVTFLPHANAEPFIGAFGVPADVAIAKLSSGTAQSVFARTAVFVTDYTSVAFTFALLRRPIFYYQFDQKDFYSGGHNWRSGYFDYARDGFGPVALSEQDLIDAIQRCVGQDLKVNPLYFARMERSMPDIEGKSCQAAFEAVAEIDRPRAP